MPVRFELLRQCVQCGQSREGASTRSTVTPSARFINPLRLWNAARPASSPKDVECSLATCTKVEIYASMTAPLKMIAF